MTLPVGHTMAILLVHGRRCRYCNKSAVESDHIVPECCGGSNDPSNLVASCRSCNAKKRQLRLEPEVEKMLLAEAALYANEVRRLSQIFRDAQKLALVRSKRKEVFYVS